MSELTEAVLQNIEHNACQLSEMSSATVRRLLTDLRVHMRRAEEAEQRAANAEAEPGILLEWRCEACNWRTVLPAPGFPGDGYRHHNDARGGAACGPLVARRVGGWSRLPPGASPEEIAEALESTR